MSNKPGTPDDWRCAMRRIMVLMEVSLLILAMGIAFTACGGGSDSSGPEWAAMEKLQSLSADDITHV